MQVQAIHTKAFVPPRDEITSELIKKLPQLKDGDVVVISSKIVSIDEGHCVQAGNKQSKDMHIPDEAQYLLPRACVPNHHVMLTITHNTLLAAAGIDKSNAGEYMILLPKDPMQSAQRIWESLTYAFKIKKLGVIISDSASSPMRLWVTGTSLGFYGIAPLKDYCGETDIFGREMQISRVNVIDSLAATGVFAMGEGSEQTPIAHIRGMQNLSFINSGDAKALYVDPQDDIFYPLLSPFFFYCKFLNTMDFSKNTYAYFEKICQDAGLTPSDELYDEFKQWLESYVGQQILARLEPTQALDMMYNKDPESFLRSSINDFDELLQTGLEEYGSAFIQKHTKKS